MKNINTYLRLVSLLRTLDNQWCQRQTFQVDIKIVYNNRKLLLKVEASNEIVKLKMGEIIQNISVEDVIWNVFFWWLRCCWININSFSRNFILPPLYTSGCMYVTFHSHFASVTECSIHQRGLTVLIHISVCLQLFLSILVIKTKLGTGSSD